jgi:hypothetical protein
VPRYAFLLRAGANRVYGEAAFALAAAELRAFGARALTGIEEIARRDLAGVEYLVVDAAEITKRGRQVLGNLSSLHAAYELESDGRLRPLGCRPLRQVDEDITTIQRYVGKTNEAFTHLLVNVALAASGDALDRVLTGERVHLLDPTCGRGTTLNRAAVYGMDAHGVEVDRRALTEHESFLTTWLKDKRLKHSVSRVKLRKGRPTPVHRTTISYGATKAVDTHRAFDLVHDDARNVGEHLAARSVDLIACDLPYGVQHASRTPAEARSRGPARLLGDALPAWREALVPGGAMAMAWNRRTLPREDLEALVAAAGLRVESPGDEGFVHRVDRSITRDLLVATRPVP